MHKEIMKHNEVENDKNKINFSDHGKSLQTKSRLAKSKAAKSEESSINDNKLRTACNKIKDLCNERKETILPWKDDIQDIVDEFEDFYSHLDGDHDKNISSMPPKEYIGLPPQETRKHKQLKKL